MNHRHHVTIAGIDINPARRARILGFQHRRSGRDFNVGHVCQGDLLLHRRQDRQLAQCLRTIAPALRITQINGITGNPFHRFANHRPAHRRSHKQLHIRHRHTVTRGFFTVNLNVDIAPTFQTLGKRRSHAWYRSCHLFNLLRHRVDIRQHSAGNFNADGAFNASREHIDTVTNWRHPQIRQPRQPHGVIQFLNDFVHRHARPPLILRLKLDSRFYHLQWS